MMKFQMITNWDVRHVGQNQQFFNWSLHTIGDVHVHCHIRNINGAIELIRKSNWQKPQKEKKTADAAEEFQTWSQWAVAP